MAVAVRHRDVQYSVGEYIRQPVREAPALFGYRVGFGKKLCLSCGYQTDGARMTAGELVRLKIRLSHLGICLATGDLIQIEPNKQEKDAFRKESSVNCLKIFSGLNSDKKEKQINVLRKRREPNESVRSVCSERHWPDSRQADIEFLK